MAGDGRNPDQHSEVEIRDLDASEAEGADDVQGGKFGDVTFNARPDGLDEVPSS